MSINLNLMPVAPKRKVEEGSGQPAPKEQNVKSKDPLLVCLESIHHANILPNHFSKNLVDIVWEYAQFTPIAQALKEQIPTLIAPQPKEIQPTLRKELTAIYKDPKFQDNPELYKNNMETALRLRPRMAADITLTVFNQFLVAYYEAKKFYTHAVSTPVVEKTE